MQTQNAPTKVSIKSLRQSGWKVRVLHQRNYQLKNKSDMRSVEVAPTGGQTEIQLTSPDGKINTSGKSVCSQKDHFNRKIGNAIALGRAWSLACQAA
jgi:peptidyl-tRNA hydrolase